MENTRIDWVQIDDADCLKFTFKDIFTHKEAMIASQEWKSSFQERVNNRFVVIFDAKAMKNYEPLARSVWQKTMTELKGQIESIWLVTDSKIIAAGAKIMSVFTSFNIKTVSAEENIILKKNSMAA
uniref:Uncharacterized protein n=1 Tax=Roseihalotalea indica TaxID=2867963 RepID=A0AA49GQ16_9BACT|nr:hypothetical protein K4G66_09015 [Tunicatimonas sp. TK19036]